MRSVNTIMRNTTRLRKTSSDAAATAAVKDGAPPPPVFVHPPSLDWRTATAADMRAALDQHSMFFLCHHGLERQYSAALEEADGLPGTVDLIRAGVPCPSWSDLRSSLCKLGAEVVMRIAGEGRLGEEAMRARGAGLTASLTLRRYSAGGSLGAHTDANLLTLLYADEVGLQVYEPPECHDPEAITKFGLPRTDVPVQDFAAPADEGRWLTVALPEDRTRQSFPLLVTLGSSWFDEMEWGTPLLPGRNRARPVLHRVDVALASAGVSDARISMASLLRVVSGPELDDDAWVFSTAAE